MKASLFWQPTNDAGTAWQLMLRHVDGDTVRLARATRLGVPDATPLVWWQATVEGTTISASVDQAVDWAERAGLGNVGLELELSRYRRQRATDVRCANARAA